MSDIIHTWRKPTSLEIEAARLRKKRRDRFAVGVLTAITIAIAMVVGRA